MRGPKSTMVALALLITFSGCATTGFRGAIPDVGVRAANYTENYIAYFYLSTPESGTTRFAGTSIKEFSRGGTGGGVCCFSLGKPGQEIRVEWYTGQRNDPESYWVHHSAVALARGAVSVDSDSNTSLIVRFFPDDEVEAEYVVQEEEPDSVRNPRIDLIFTGQRVNRHIGD